MTPPAAGSPPRRFDPGPFSYHQEVELEIESLTHLGSGLGRVDGWVVMVAFTLPGERVKARVFRNHANFSEADLTEVLRAAPERVEPRCALFGRCGGCQYQHLHYEGQLRWKTRQVAETLERIAGITNPPVEAAMGSPAVYGYRSKLTPHWEPARKGEPVGAIGFLPVTGRKLVDVPQCPIATEAINAALPGARAEVRAGRPPGGKKGGRGGTLLLRHTLEGVTSVPDALVSERVGTTVFQFKAFDFFQNNPFILPALVDWVGEQAAGAGIRHLVDAYCGTGLFALCLSPRFEQVVGVEISPTAAQWADNNALINRRPNCRFQVGTAADIFQGIGFGGAETAVIIDPPRKGCEGDFLRQLFQFGPQRVVYVSCDPATQARDLREFLAAGYRLRVARPFDLFPQTRHIECVATLERA